MSGENGIGHAVTGVGYIESWDPDDDGPLPTSDYAIVHDTWDTTAKNLGVPWQNGNATVTVALEQATTQARDLWISPQLPSI